MKMMLLVLALNWKAEPQFGGFYAAQLNGEFKKRQLEVRIVEGGSGTPTVQMLGAGKVQFAIVSGEEILIARERNSKITALFAVYQTNPQAIMTRESLGFKSLKEVFASEGVLAMQKGLSYAQFLLQKYPQSKLKIVPLSGGISQFLIDSRYSQQCFATSEPLLAKKAGVKTKTFLISDEGFNPYTTVLATSEEMLKNDKATKAFVEAVRSGWKEYLKNPEPTNKFMASLNKSMDAATFAESSAAQAPLIESAETEKNHLGYMTVERWQSLIQQMRTLKLLKQDLQAQDVFRNY